MKDIVVSHYAIKDKLMSVM